MARALEATGDDTLAAEAAWHWAAAERVSEELPARVHAAEAAERVFGYVEAARHWQRAIDLCQALPGAADHLTGVDLLRLYVRALEALESSRRARASSTLVAEIE